METMDYILQILIMDSGGDAYIKRQIFGELSSKPLPVPLRERERERERERGRERERKIYKVI